MCAEHNNRLADLRRQGFDRFMEECVGLERTFQVIRESEDKARVRQLKWDRRYQDLARSVSSWSKDPSTQTGAVVVDTDNRIVALGYNGFARGVEDAPDRYADRDLKYKMVVHCEVNAVLTAGQSARGCTLYTWPFTCCSRCAAIMIQAGIARVVSPPLPDHLKERWGEDVELSAQMFAEAGVELSMLPPDGV